NLINPYPALCLKKALGESVLLGAVFSRTIWLLYLDSRESSIRKRRQQVIKMVNLNNMALDTSANSDLFHHILNELQAPLIGTFQMYEPGIACPVLSAIVKGQGYALPADVQYVDVQWEVPVVLPLHGCLVHELTCSVNLTVTKGISNSKFVELKFLLQIHCRWLEKESFGSKGLPERVSLKLQVQLCSEELILVFEEQEDKNDIFKRIGDTLDFEIKRWSTGKQGNLRALLSTLQYIRPSDKKVDYQIQKLTNAADNATAREKSGNAEANGKDGHSDEEDLLKYRPNPDMMDTDWFLHSNIRKTTFVLHKLSMAKAKRYLEDIIAHRQSIVFRRYCGVVGLKDLVVDNLYVSLIQVNLAQKQHRHIDTYMSSPCHSELFLLEKEDPMKKEVRKRAKRSESRRGRILPENMGYILSHPETKDRVQSWSDASDVLRYAFTLTEDTTDHQYE
ncbi:hypothetical protein ACJX0J_041649, partial [Zea mays]